MELITVQATLRLFKAIPVKKEKPNKMNKESYIHFKCPVCEENICSYPIDSKKTRVIISGYSTERKYHCKNLFVFEPTANLRLSSNDDATFRCR